MFCSQCEQTAKGQGCEQWGACGKSPEVDALQDLLTHCLRGLGEVAVAASQLGIRNREADVFTVETLFSTLTNVNFDPECFVNYIQRAIALREGKLFGISRCLNARQSFVGARYIVPLRTTCILLTPFPAEEYR